MRRVLCWALACLFAVGYLPGRGDGCRCTAASNCGCACWQHRLATEAVAADSDGEDAGSPCCARPARHRASTCGAADRARDAGAPLPPSNTTDPHGSSQPMDWLAAEAPRLAPPGIAIRVPDSMPVAVLKRCAEPLVPPP
jgi:hypothetical protein